LRINAYVLAGDPWWVEESIRSYYPIVDRIVVSYDASGRSWSGGPLAVEESLEHIRAVDSDSKCVFAPGEYARPGQFILDVEHAQRQAAFDHASEGADWVLQIDTDEVVGDLTTFSSCLEEADVAHAGGLEYPARYLYARTRSGLFLERSTRAWRTEASYPGPVAVRARSRLAHLRQADVSLYRVDFRRRNTDPAHPRDAVVDRVVPVAAGIRHYSWVRSVDYMRRKAAWSGHSDTYTKDLENWLRRSRRPLLAVAQTPLRRAGGRFRFVRLPRDQRVWVGEDDVV
jgi:hypothetical protein